MIPKDASVGIAVIASISMASQQTKMNATKERTLSRKAKPRKETVLIFEWTELPDKLKELVTENPRFGNDIFLKLHSEFEPDGEEENDWAGSLTREQLVSYHKDQVDTNGFVGDLDKFIKEYGLEFEVWMLDQKIDFSGVKTILIEICW